MEECIPEICYQNEVHQVSAKHNKTAHLHNKTAHLHSKTAQGK